MLSLFSQLHRAYMNIVTKVKNNYTRIVLIVQLIQHIVGESVLASASHENDIAKMTFAYAICFGDLKIGQLSL